jgi:DNA polymerase eta
MASETSARLWKSELFKDSSSINTDEGEPECDPTVRATHSILSRSERPRAIVHLDADCFYASVERERLNIPEEVPLAVQQWSALIAVDYNCRRFGIRRGMTVKEATDLCPSLKCVHVEILGENAVAADTIVKDMPVPALTDRRKMVKVSLARYRRASFRTIEVFQKCISSKDILCRASIDEAYIDLTASASEVTIGDMRSYLEEVKAYTCIVGTIDLDSPFDQLLLQCAVVVHRIRNAVKSELGYNISAGIACNKLLAKIGSSRNKPNKQTIIPFRHSPAVLASLPIRGIPNLGGKLGESVEKFCRNTLQDIMLENVPTSVLQRIKVSSLIQNFGAEQGLWLHQISHGVDESNPVEQRNEPKSLLAMKSFEKTNDCSFLITWLGKLSQEVFDRYLEDKVMFKRRPQNLVLHHRSFRPLLHTPKDRPEGSSTSITVSASIGSDCNLKSSTIETVAISLFDRVEHRFPCTAIGLSLTRFTPLPREGRGSITAFLRKAGELEEAVGFKFPVPARLKTSATMGDDVDQSVLSALPEDIRHEIVTSMVTKVSEKNGKQSLKKRTLKDLFSARNVDKKMKRLKQSNGLRSQQLSLPDWGSVDQETFAQLPTGIQRELEVAYAQRRPKKKITSPQEAARHGFRIKTQGNLGFKKKLKGIFAKPYDAQGSTM